MVQDMEEFCGAPTGSLGRLGCQQCGGVEPMSLEKTTLV